MFWKNNNIMLMKPAWIWHVFSLEPHGKISCKSVHHFLLFHTVDCLCMGWVFHQKSPPRLHTGHTKNFSCLFQPRNTDTQISEHYLPLLWPVCVICQGNILASLQDGSCIPTNCLEGGRKGDENKVFLSCQMFISKNKILVTITIEEFSDFDSLVTR